MSFADFFSINLTTILIALGVGVIAYYKWSFTYWKRKGVPIVVAPSIPFGNMTDLMFKRKHFGVIWKDYYHALKQKDLPFGGAYFFTSKVFVPTNIELIKNIMVKDFQHFVNHGLYVNEIDDPLSGNLFALEDTKWRNLRVKLTPTFTSGKMKMMFQTMADCASILSTILDKTSEQGVPLDIKEILTCFTTDIIGSCAFGVECNSLKNPNSDFRKYGKAHLEEDFGALFRNFLQFIFPESVLKMFKFKVTKPDVTNFFVNMIESTINYREKNNIFRKDFMHLMIQLKNMGKLTDDEKLTDKDGSFGEVGLNTKEIAAQAFVFFIGGFETSSTTMTFALYEIALNSEIQRKMREEINSALSSTNGNITYETTMSMPYMDKVINETLRKYPPVPAIPRVCTKDYHIPNSNVIIEKGTTVGIPVLGIHHDHEFYPNPEIFDPERFSEEQKAERPPFTWLPFGEGPRICIGLRFGVMQTKMGLMTILRDYEISISPKTPVPIKLSSHGFILSSDDCIWLNIKKIEK